MGLLFFTTCWTSISKNTLIKESVTETDTLKGTPTWVEQKLGLKEVSLNNCKNLRRIYIVVFSVIKLCSNSFPIFLVDIWHNSLRINKVLYCRHSMLGDYDSDPVLSHKKCASYICRYIRDTRFNHPFTNS